MIEDIINQIASSPIGIKMKRSYSNSVEISGWVLQEPKYVKNEKTNNETCSFILYQIGTMLNGDTFVKTFNVITYSRELIKRLREEIHGNVFFIAATCSLVWNGKIRSYNCHMGNFMIPCELDTKLEPPYAKEKKDG